MKKIICIVSLLLLFTIGCKTPAAVKDDAPDNSTQITDSIEPDGDTVIPDIEPVYKKPDAFNLKIVIRTVNIVPAPESIKTYYRIFIDGTEQGRTTIGEESEEKIFEASVSAENHTVTIEKYMLDERRGKYVKLKNIEQPKPDSYTFDLPAERILKLSFEEDGSTGSGVFAEELEKE